MSEWLQAKIAVMKKRRYEKQKSQKSRLNMNSADYKRYVQSKKAQPQRKSRRQRRSPKHLRAYVCSIPTNRQEPPLAPPKLQLRQAAGEWRDCDDVPDQTLSGFIKACRAGVDSYEFELHGVRRTTNFYVMRLLGKPESYILRNVHQPGDKLLARLSGA